MRDLTLLNEAILFVVLGEKNLFFCSLLIIQKLLEMFFSFLFN